MPSFRDYQAPKADGSVFADPSLAKAETLLRHNESVLARHPDWLKRLRVDGRTELIRSAIQYSSAYRDVGWAEARDGGPVVMAGHQPALFHPGVWFKNFALSHLGNQLSAIAINLVVDNDVCGVNAIRVPTIDFESGRAKYVSVPFDNGGGGVPYEQTLIRDRGLFESFGDRVQAMVRPLVERPAIEQLWPHAIEAIDRCGFAGCAFAQARHALEGQLGQQTLEIPVSVAFRSLTFAQFLMRILVDLDRFVDCYNDSVEFYRAVHGIRSSAHPVPNLAVRDGWTESPLWVYGNQSPTRHQVWIRRQGNRLELSDLLDRRLTIDISDPDQAAVDLRDQCGPDFKIRPRALLTTMYSRLVLSDLFLHGIGGGKYDQLGDVITQRFFGVTPADFMVLSATVLIPGSDTVDASQVIARLRERIRATTFQPEQFGNDVSLPSSLLQAKADLLANIPPQGQRKQWHDQLTRINAELSAKLEPVRNQLLLDLAAARADLTSENLLHSREHSFAVHPLDSLVDRFKTMLSA